MGRLVSHIDGFSGPDRVSHIDRFSRLDGLCPPAAAWRSLRILARQGLMVPKLRWCCTSREMRMRAMEVVIKYHRVGESHMSSGSRKMSMGTRGPNRSLWSDVTTCQHAAKLWQGVRH